MVLLGIASNIAPIDLPERNCLNTILRPSPATGTNAIKLKTKSNQLSLLFAFSEILTIETMTLLTSTPCPTKGIQPITTATIICAGLDPLPSNTPFIQSAADCSPFLVTLMVLAGDIATAVRINHPQNQNVALLVHSMGFLLHDQQ